MFKNLLLAAWLLAASWAGASAQQQASQTLTLEDCIRLAEAAPSPLSLARLERDITSRDVTQARAGFLPQSRLANGFIYNSPLLYNREVFSYVPLNGIREYAALLSVNQEVDTSGRLRAELDRARAAEQASAAGVALARRDLRRAVTAAYYRTLLKRHLARIAEDALAESRSFENRVRLLFQGGEAAQADLVKASAQVAFLEQAANAAALDAQLANQELASFWTSEVNSALALEDVLENAAPPPEPEVQQPPPYFKRVEFNLFDAQRRGFEADARRARSALLPQLGLSFQYGLDSTAVRIRDRGYAAFVNLSIPLFDWKRSLSAMQQARLRTQQAVTARRIAERTFSKEYEGALARVRRIYEQISLAGRQVKLAQEDLRLSRIRYEGGEGSALDVLTAQSQLAQARSNYYTALAEYWNARADLEVAAGR